MIEKLQIWISKRAVKTGLSFLMSVCGFILGGIGWSVPIDFPLLNTLLFFGGAGMSSSGGVLFLLNLYIWNKEDIEAERKIRSQNSISQIYVINREILRRKKIVVFPILILLISIIVILIFRTN